jgi:cytidine deaminase
MIGSQSNELLEIASALLEDRYNPPVHSVAAALRTTSGEIITAMNIDHFSGYVCAETAALSKAINERHYEFESIVAVRRSELGETIIANMCGKCRQVFYDYAPGITVVVASDGHLAEKTISELLPFPFTRQREKIQALIKKDVVV